jgi:hypothetical protein
LAELPIARVRQDREATAIEPEGVLRAANRRRQPDADREER